jgi:proteasome lid subunit RPN8/RPN11
MELTISRALLDEIRAHAADDPEREVCGLLLGAGGVVARVVRCANVAADPRRQFELDPAALIAAHSAARAGGLRPIGHYHSHPSGRAVPSALDAAMADPGNFWLIIAGDEIACWWSQSGGSVEHMFVPVMLC